MIILLISSTMIPIRNVIITIMNTAKVMNAITAIAVLTDVIK